MLKICCLVLHSDVVLLFEKNSLDCIFDSRWGNDPRFKMARRLRGRIVYQSIRRGPSSPPRGRRDSVSVSRDRGRRSRERSPRDNYHHASRRSRSRTRRGPIDRTHDREPSRSAQYRDSSVHRSVREVRDTFEFHFLVDSIWIFRTPALLLPNHGAGGTRKLVLLQFLSRKKN
ncbi:hypothetical protein K474DRAFT_639216 [Panus rudis PR-1116 ss-1]|nr:hypothetical protein K474DRAFT_639216 [Panus rudis PR-1116 ss-1]